MDRMDRTKKYWCLNILFGFGAAAVYASLALVASAVVVRVAGWQGTGVGFAVMAVGTLVGGCTASWRTQPHIHRVVIRLLPGDERTPPIAAEEGER
jgi:hypothetical protein